MASTVVGVTRNALSIPKARKSFKRSTPKKLIGIEGETGGTEAESGGISNEEEVMPVDCKEENNNKIGDGRLQEVGTNKDGCQPVDEGGIDITDVLDSIEENDYEGFSDDEVRKFYQKMPLQVQPHRIRKNPKTMQFECPYCSFSSLYYSAVSNHTLIHTGEKPYLCHLCNYRARQRGHILIHMRIHSGKKPFKCPQCSYSTIQRNHLRVHLQVHSQDRPFQCPGCPYRSKHLSVLQMHLRKYGHNRSFQCSQCDYATARKHNLAQHMSVHTGSKPYKCGLCPYESSQKGHLNVHIRSHTGEKPFKCHECPFACTVPKSLREHMGMHQGQRPHQCPHCSFSTMQPFALKKHVSLHIIKGETFQCGQCSYSSSVQEDFLVHCAIHTTSVTYSCPSCDFTTPFKVQYAMHLMSHTETSDILTYDILGDNKQDQDWLTKDQTETGKSPPGKAAVAEGQLSYSSADLKNGAKKKKSLIGKSDHRLKLNIGFLTSRARTTSTKREIQQDTGSESQSSSALSATPVAQEVDPLPQVQCFLDDQSRMKKSNKAFVCLYCDTKLPSQDQWVAHEMRHFNSWPEIV
ncbi:zinc finger protein 271-like [Acanthaster planci]|uniref:Zinc finger protein 271-like n=1 Tax=Acanthaster planci TaxID=133434 RepID=A0A8B7YER3_ACAPL|nr:zinc finger protein 271-like [Acanthaster planci]XP_022091071.1 zinc finger protein 271-like [Acanthaster planci]XP_022091072.1 zinc finger protein 271-like [Acanthaster planci]XP_022091073.1 zinc finger protein 271-like [Acanthaster planci]XP_022091074.1 zinc finger protein 271-like [Acanthaster planci]XP_022091075.1 zinc finger protein 271-like [Acanthaster planci]